MAKDGEYGFWCTEHYTVYDKKNHDNDKTTPDNWWAGDGHAAKVYGYRCPWSVDVNITITGG